MFRDLLIKSGSSATATKSAAAMISRGTTTLPKMRKVGVICLALAVFCTIAVAGKKFPMTPSSIVPAATGHVDIDKDKNGNTTVSISVEHLANPNNLTPSADMYIVWLQERGASPENHGVMKVDKDLQAKFDTGTAFKIFDVFITGERDKSAKVPGGPEVFRAAIQP